MWTTFKTTVRTLLLTPSAVVWTLIFPIVLATVFNFMFEPMRSTGSVEAVDVAVVADYAWEDTPSRRSSRGRREGGARPARRGVRGRGVYRRRCGQ